jgi:hypothetical protein
MAENQEGITNDNSVQVEPVVMSPASVRGRAEALQIILALDPEEGLDDFIESSPDGDSGDYSTYWNKAKLKKLLRVGGEYENSPGAKIARAADDMYWEMVAKSDDFATLKKLVQDLLGQIERGKINSGPWCTVDILKTWI